MTELVFRARAKVNLALDIIGLRDDGYHELKMILASVGLEDEIKLTLLNEPLFSVDTNLAYLPTDGKNLAITAAKLFLERTGRAETGAHIVLRKRIPVAAGLGGGSSDAAAVLSGLNAYYGGAVPAETLSEWALELGSDVPYCLRGGVALAAGRGEMLTGLPPLPKCQVVLCRPPVAISTKRAFKTMSAVKIRSRPDFQGMINALNGGNLNAVARRMYNVFEGPMSARIKTIGRIHSLLIDAGALGACMSGSGATVFGLFDNPRKAQSAYDLLRQEFDDTFLTQSE